MPDERTLTPFAVTTYRYLRLAIVVVLAALLAAVFIERRHTTCWEESISAYFYTPVLVIFTGSLIAVGVSLIAIKGVPTAEDIALNLAGLLAPVVAVVPTSPPTRSCASTPFVQQDPEAFIDNNVLALVIAGVIAIVVAVIASRRTGGGDVPTIEASAAIGFAFAIAVLVVGVGWYAWFRESFLEYAHGVAAVMMFVSLFGAIVINAATAGPGIRTVYAGVAIAMVAILVGTVVGGWIDPDWRHQILWLELLELIAVTVYWAVQTVEHWNGGVDLRRSPPPSRS